MLALKRYSTESDTGGKLYDRYETTTIDNKREIRGLFRKAVEHNHTIQVKKYALFHCSMSLRLGLLFCKKITSRIYQMFMH